MTFESRASAGLGAHSTMGNPVGVHLRFMGVPSTYYPDDKHTCDHAYTLKA